MPVYRKSSFRNDRGTCIGESGGVREDADNVAIQSEHATVDNGAGASVTLMGESDESHQ